LDLVGKSDEHRLQFVAAFRARHQQNPTLAARQGGGDTQTLVRFESVPQIA
jgi:hypothetical protein